VTQLFDSTILISHLLGDRRATDLLLEATSDGALASVISRAEIEGGMRSEERGDVSRLFEGLRLIPVTDAAARRAGRYLRQFCRSHPGIDLADYLIAASAEEANATLVTLNLRHVPMIEGLTAP
jgi:predicted nucleic acid-binding protein